MKGQSKYLKIVLVKEFPCTIPKGPLREQLVKVGRLKEVSFTRVMSESHCQDIILDAFKNIGLKKFRYLQVQKDHSLKHVSDQILDGNSVINLAGSGSLYLQEIRNEDAPDDSTCPSASSLTQSSKAHVRFHPLIIVQVIIGKIKGKAHVASLAELVRVSSQLTLKPMTALDYPD